MVETLTPAGCGSRQRYRVAIVLFSLGAIGAAAALGALLGAAGSSLDRSAALAVVAVLALIAGAREAGILRMPVPELRRQVPERWRREWPLAAWSLGYGAGLGVGVLTHQVVWTFWVAAAGALALGDPLVSAACLMPFGLGRALMVILPTRGGRDGSASVGRLVERRRLLRPVNAGALLLAAALLSAVPAIGQGATRGEYDPAAAGRVVATGIVDAAGAPSVIVRPATLPSVVFPGGRSRGSTVTCWSMPTTPGCGSCAGARVRRSPGSTAPCPSRRSTTRWWPTPGLCRAVSAWSCATW